MSNVQYVSGNDLKALDKSLYEPMIDHCIDLTVVYLFRGIHWFAYLFRLFNWPYLNKFW